MCHPKRDFFKVKNTPHRVNSQGQGFIVPALDYWGPTSNCRGPPVLQPEHIKSVKSCAVLNETKKTETQPNIAQESDSTYSISFVSWNLVITEGPGYSTYCIYQYYKVMRQ